MTGMFDGMFLSPTAGVAAAPREPDFPPDDDGDFHGAPALPPLGGGSVADGLCTKCGVNPLPPYKGKGPRPKYCVSCKSTRTSGGAVSGDAPVRVRGMDKLQHDLERGAGQFAASIAVVTPVAAGVTMLQGPDVIAGLISIAEDQAAAGHSGMMDGLKYAARMVKWGDVGQGGAAFLYALLVDFGKARPDTLPGHLLGVDAAAEKMGWTPPAERKRKAQHDAATVIDGDAVGVSVPPPRFTMTPGGV